MVLRDKFCASGACRGQGAFTQDLQLEIMLMASPRPVYACRLPHLMVKFNYSLLTPTGDI